MADLLKRIAELNLKCEELEAKVAYQDKLLRADEYTFLPRSWGLTPTEHQILIYLYTAPGHIRSYESIITITNNGDDRMRKSCSLYMHVNQMRKKLRPQAIFIETILKFGYRLLPTSAAILKEHLALAPNFSEAELEKFHEHKTP